jgi:teichuronic acid exporter
VLVSIFKGAGKVALGTAAGQGVVLLATPWLSRQYSPAEFGSLALLLTISNIASALACLRYDLTIPVASKSEAPALFSIAISAAATSALLVLAVLTTGVFTPILAATFNATWVIGLCVLLVGVQQAVIGALTRDGRYAGVGVVRFGQGGLFTALAVIPSLGLLISHALSFLVVIPFAVRRLFRNKTSIKEISRTAYERRNFPLLSLPGALLDVIGYSACVWIMAHFYGVSETGQYSQIQRIVGAPLMLVGMSVGQVLLRSGADAIRDHSNSVRLFRRVSAMSLLLGLLVVLLISLIGDSLLHWLLGPKWRVDTAFIVPVAIAVTVRACVSPLSSLLVALNRFDLALRWQVFYFLSSISVLTVVAINVSFEYFIVVYAIHEILLYSLYLVLISKAVRDLKCAAYSV